MEMLRQYQHVTYLGYTYPQYAVIIGIILSLVPVAPLPIGMLMALLPTHGNILERLRRLLEPENWGPGDSKYQETYLEMEIPKAQGVKDFFTMNLFGG